MPEQLYTTKSGTRVRIAQNKQFPSHPSDPAWQNKMREEANKALRVIRVKDGHELWGCRIEDLTPIKN